MLKVTHLSVFYGPVPALIDVSMSVAAGSRVVVLGPNGAGKSTLLRALSGLVTKPQGLVELDGEVLLRRGLGMSRLNVRQLKPHELVRRGIIHVPEGRQVFPQLTVLENLRLGAYALKRKATFAEDLERVFGYFPVLAEKRKKDAHGLSGGEQQMLAVGRGLLGRPRLLMLDEPSIGLAPRVVNELFEVLARVCADTGCALLLVEQNVAAALSIAERAYVMEAPGHVAFHGDAAELSKDSSIQRVFLGA